MSDARIVRRARIQPRLDRRLQAAALTHLVADAFEVHDERVRGDTDRDDETGDAGQAQPEALAPAEQEHKP